VAEWPGGARGALCLSFDNLGVDEATSAAAALSPLLGELMLRGLPATFFIEGVNAELSPVELLSVHLANHELAYHAWRHEQWSELSAAEQAENLERGLAAFRGLALGAVELRGFRPPGGLLGDGGLDVLRAAGLRYCSPAGEGVGVEDGIAVLPFQWQHVDATCVLPALGPVRERMSGSPDPLDPEAFLAHLEAEIDRLASEGGFATIVLHPHMFEWHGPNLARLLDRLRDANRAGDLWLARFDQVAAHVLSHPAAFAGSATLDPTTWAA